MPVKATKNIIDKVKKTINTPHMVDNPLPMYSFLKFFNNFLLVISLL